MPKSLPQTHLIQQPFHRRMKILSTTNGIFTIQLHSNRWLYMAQTTRKTSVTHWKSKAVRSYIIIYTHLSRRKRKRKRKRILLLLRRRMKTQKQHQPCRLRTHYAKMTFNDIPNFPRAFSKSSASFAQNSFSFLKMLVESLKAAKSMPLCQFFPYLCTTFRQIPCQARNL